MSVQEGANTSVQLRTRGCAVCWGCRDEFRLVGGCHNNQCKRGSRTFCTTRGRLHAQKKSALHSESAKYSFRDLFYSLHERHASSRACKTSDAELQILRKVHSYRCAMLQHRVWHVDRSHLAQRSWTCSALQTVSGSAVTRCNCTRQVPCARQHSSDRPGGFTARRGAEQWGRVRQTSRTRSQWMLPS